MPLSASSPQGTTISRLLNRLKYAFTDVADDITTAATGDIVMMLDASDNYTPKYADADNLREMTKAIVSVPDANTPISAANTGKPHLVANVSADRTFTLPTPAAGLDIEFIATVGAADGHDWIINTGSDTNYFVGAITHLDTDANGAGDEIVNVSPDGNSNSKLQINVPEGGTVVRLVCDGTLWVVSGVAVSATAPTFADQ
jgi:hypothetical protein